MPSFLTTFTFAAMAGLASCQAAPTKVAPPPNDQIVLQEVCDSFFAETKWNDSWDQGKTVVLSIREKSASRPDFAVMLTEDLKDLSRFDPIEFDNLKKVFESQSGTPTKSKVPIVELGDLSFKKNVIVSSSDSAREAWWTRRAFKHGDTKTTVRAPYTLKNWPSYSQDGKYARVEGHLPWSIHSATLTVYLEKKSSNRWTILATRHLIYP